MQNTFTDDLIWEAIEWLLSRPVEEEVLRWPFLLVHDGVDYEGA